METKMGRREFLGKTALFASGVSLTLQGGGSKAYAASATESTPGTTKQTPKRIKRIALEEHWSNQELDQIGMKWRATTGSQVGLDARKLPPAFLTSIKRQRDFEEFRLPLMDQHGIDIQVLALSSPGIQALDDPAKAVDLAKRTNDFQAGVIQKHPDRFAGFAALPTQYPKAAADELERTVTQLKFKGAMIQGHTNWEYLDAPKFRVIWERAADLEVPLYLHINDPSVDSRKVYEGYPQLAGSMWGWGVEAATHALRIISSGVFDAYPKAMLILGHLGESLPYLLGRLDEGYGALATVDNRKLKKSYSEYIRNNFLVTTSGLYRPEALVCAISAMGPDRVLYSTDYPFVDLKASVALFDKTPMSNEVREKISHLNAERWLRL